VIAENVFLIHRLYELSPRPEPADPGSAIVSGYADLLLQKEGARYSIFEWRDRVDPDYEELGGRALVHVRTAGVAVDHEPHGELHHETHRRRDRALGLLVTLARRASTRSRRRS
jgi:hypothetical protein